MGVHSKNSALLILAITAITCSRIVFALFDDLEGPNLLVVMGLAVVIYIISAAAYLSNLTPALTGFGRTSVTIFIQICVATALYVALR